MKKTLFSCFTAIVLALFAQLSFADAAPTTPYYTSLEQAASKSLHAVASNKPATDIAVINLTPYDITVTVPNSPINDRVSSDRVDHVKNDTWAGRTELRLYGISGIFFQNNPVANHAIVVVVLDDSGHYVVKVV